MDRNQNEIYNINTKTTYLKNSIILSKRKGKNMKIKKDVKDNFSFKCDSPKNTLKRITEGLKKLKIDVEYTPYEYNEIECIYTGRLDVPSLNITSYGKGITPDLAKASAFAELIERISTRHFKRYFFPVKEEFKEREKEIIKDFFNFKYLEGYTYSHQKGIKNKVTIESLLSKEYIYTKKDIEYLKNDDISHHWVDGYSLISGRKIKVPLLFVKRISLSNGLASGNTREEALIQGSNEIFERYLKIKLLKNKKTIPSIKKSSIKDPLLNKIINSFEKNGFEIIIKDFSDSMLFPSFGVLFINKNIKNTENKIKQTYKYKTLVTAASLNPKEAIIRCFTEKLQGYPSFEEFKFLKKDDLIWKYWFQKNRFRLQMTGDYLQLAKHNIFDGNLSFLEKGEEIDFNSFNHSYRDCNEEINHIKEVCKKIKTDFIFVDQTHPVLNFPVIRVIMPGVSDFLKYIKEEDKSPKRLTSFLDIEEKNRYLEYAYSDDWYDSKEKLERLVHIIEEDIQKRPYELQKQKLGFNNKPIDLFNLLMVLYFKLDDYEKIKSCVEIISANNPKYTMFFNKLFLLAKIKNKRGIFEELQTINGCNRYLISGIKNPFTDCCDDPCPNDCEESYKKKMLDLIESFFVQ